MTVDEKQKEAAMEKQSEIETTVESTEAAVQTMESKLIESGEKAVKEQAQRRARAVKGSHLLTPMLELAKAAGLTVVDKKAFHQFNAGVKNKNVYLDKRGGRVDLSGFTFDDEAVRQISSDEAKERHLGRVRGQIDFEKSDDLVLKAFGTALEALKIPNPVEPKAEKAPEADEPAAE